MDGCDVGDDGSPTASAAIDAGALLFPQAHAWLTYLWTSPFASVGSSAGGCERSLTMSTS